MKTLGNTSAPHLSRVSLLSHVVSNMIELTAEICLLLTNMIYNCFGHFHLKVSLLAQKL